MKTSRKLRVLVAMSGGVDSSVAALLMKKQGYEVIGVFMKNWSDTKNPLTGECNWKAERRMAANIASILGIKLITLDSEKEYKSLVVNEMINLYKKGITPNPDVDCNNKIKFPLLWKAAKNPKIKADFIVTGHYAQIKKVKSSEKEASYQLLRAEDESKDQSYFLYRLNQDDLKHTLFPIGKYKKLEVREIAKKHKFPNYDKKGTVGICFIGKINLKQFLKNKIKPKKGNIIDPEEKIIGQHDGIYYYTINQRLGPRYGIELSKSSDNPKNIKKWYVAKKDLKSNTITAAPEGHKILLRKEITIIKPHFINKNEKIKNGKRQNVNVRIRHVGELLPATILKHNNKFKVTLKKAITGISEGQAIVIYRKNSKQVLGGGVISF